MSAGTAPSGSLKISNHMDQDAPIGTHCFSAIGVRYRKWPLPSTSLHQATRDRQVAIADCSVSIASHFESAVRPWR